MTRPLLSGRKEKIPNLAKPNIFLLLKTAFFTLIFDFLSFFCGAIPPMTLFNNFKIFLWVHGVHETFSQRSVESSIATLQKCDFEASFCKCAHCFRHPSINLDPKLLSGKPSLGFLAAAKPTAQGMESVVLGLF